MSNTDNVTSYLIRITHINDQLAVNGEMVLDAEHVNVALNSFPNSWDPFVKGLVARKNLPCWQRLWDDCI